MTSTTDDRPASASATNSGAGADGNDGGGRTAAARQAFESARERTASAYAAARERAGSAYETAGRRTSEGIDSNPVAAVVGGLAIGAIVAALLPRTRREDELLGDVGRRINDGAREATRAARESGRAQLDELGLSRDGLRSKLDEFTDRAVGAVKSSAGAAAGAARGRGEA
ncbi:MAG: hypothetical protein QOG72_208 [Sphingomonadales bacterium]|jgi:hypothetical protein|nr:hypothetical protein [Sphingomonadales bacterium]